MEDVKMSWQMMEALCTAGRSGSYPVFGKAMTLRALAKRGYVTIDKDNDRRATITQSGLEVSAEQRKTAITA